MITCKSGVTIRMKVADISEQGRATQGVKLIRLDEGDEIAAITKLNEQVGAEANGHNGNVPNGSNETIGPEATDGPENSSEQKEPE